MSSGVTLAVARGAMAARMSGRCLVCGDPLRAPIRRCPACDTPHHHLCWDYVGGCSVYACLANAPQRYRDLPPGHEPSTPPADPFRAAPGAGWTLAHYLAIAVMIWVGSSLRETDRSRSRARKVAGAHAAVCRAPSARRTLDSLAPVSAAGTGAPVASRRLPRSLDRLIRDDRLWEGTGSTPGRRLVAVLCGPLGRTLARDLSRVARSDLPAWQRVRARALLHVVLWGAGQPASAGAPRLRAAPVSSPATARAARKGRATAAGARPPSIATERSAG
jgi:hypothetical protein